VQSLCVPFSALFLTAICEATSIDACTEQATVIKALCEALVTNQHLRGSCCELAGLVILPLWDLAFLGLPMRLC
jgi:hypothetical protein